MFKRVGFTYVQKENFQLVKTLGFYFVRFNIVGIILFTCSLVISWDCILQRSTALPECVFCDSGDRSGCGTDDGKFKGILRRGYWLETKAVAKHAIIVTVCVIAYLFAMKESSNYSRVVIFAFPIISICVLYIGRILLKKWLSKHRGPASGKRAILLIGGKKNYREIVEAFTSNPYSEFHVMGIGIIDAKENEIPNYHGFPVFCGESAIEDFAQLNWVDEALFSIPTELPLPDKMIKNFGIMGITIHIKLARVADDSSNQIVEKLEGYTVLSTSINMVSAGQLIFKRTMDICGGLVGMLLTGIIFIFVAPIIYIKSPGPIFFKQVRIGKNGKKFNIYKFRSMYMDAEERKKELMAQNDIKDGMMFKMDNDPRIIKGIGNFIRDYSLDEFPQFWNVLIGVGGIIEPTEKKLDFTGFSLA